MRCCAVQLCDIFIILQPFTKKRGGKKKRRKKRRGGEIRGNSRDQRRVHPSGCATMLASGNVLITSYGGKKKGEGKGRKKNNARGIALETCSRGAAQRKSRLLLLSTIIDRKKKEKRKERKKKRKRTRVREKRGVTGRPSICHSTLPLSPPEERRKKKKRGGGERKRGKIPRKHRTELEITAASHRQASEYSNSFLTSSSSR